MVSFLFLLEGKQETTKKKPALIEQARKTRSYLLRRQQVDPNELAQKFSLLAWRRRRSLRL